jgi:hypothetical protein
MISRNSYSYYIDLAEKIKSVLAQYPTSGQLTLIGMREDWYAVVEALEAFAEQEPTATRELAAPHKE